MKERDLINYARNLARLLNYASKQLAQNKIEDCKFGQGMCREQDLARRVRCSPRTKHKATHPACISAQYQFWYSFPV